MALRAKKPIVKEARLKTLIYGNKGTGKTHLCCSFPSPYYIDTEGLEDYPHFVDMILKNKGDIVRLNDIDEIIKEVKDLMSTKHDYKTLIIDSISFPYAWLTQMEAERLCKKSPKTEGTEYGANLAKAKRLIFQLGILLSRLDMNVVVISHEKTLYADNKEIGKTFDVNEKLAYSLGSVWNLKLIGKDDHKLYIEKSRYTEMKTGDLIDFNEGYIAIENLFGKEIFVRESKCESLANSDQVKEFNRLVSLLNLPDETIQKWLRNGGAQEVDELSTSYIEKAINYLKSQVQGEAA